MILPCFEVCSLYCDEKNQYSFNLCDILKILNMMLQCGHILVTEISSKFNESKAGNKNRRNNECTILINKYACDCRKTRQVVVVR